MNEQEVRQLFQFFNEIGIINQLSTTALEKSLPLNLKVSQFSLLNHLVRVGDGTTPAVLAANMQVTKGAMTNTLNRLLHHELISISKDPQDSRAKRVYLTDKGRATQMDCIMSSSADLATLPAQIPLQDFQQALPFLTKVRQVLDQNRT